MTWSANIFTVHREFSPLRKELLVNEDRTAIHSGKLGDVIYALPTCRALGINHLVLNIPADGPDLEWGLEHVRARELSALLLYQTYLKKVSIAESAFPVAQLSENPEGIHYNLDVFRNLLPNDVAPEPCNDKELRRSGTKAPVHLGQICAAAQGIQVDLTEPWLTAPPSTRRQAYVVVSLTPRWRSFSPWYWRTLLAGLPKVCLVGLPHELKAYGLDGTNFEWIQAKDHLDLATLISGSQLFLGSISFPYAVAEGLKTKRAVELCYERPDAFPTGNNGHCLPPDVIKARRLVASLLNFDKHSSYVQLTEQELRWNPLVLLKNRMLQASLAVQKFFRRTHS